MENTILKNTIMRRVKAIYFLRFFINRITIKCTALIALVFAVASAVSVADVVRNSPNFLDINAVFYFSKYAIMHTDLPVQLFLAVFVVITAWLIRDIARTLSHEASFHSVSVATSRI